MRQYLVFGPWDQADFEDKYADVSYIENLLWLNGYVISDKDVYKAWVSGGSGVWDSPFNYSDEQIVDSVLNECSLDDGGVDDEGSGEPIGTSLTHDPAMETFWRLLTGSLKHEPRIEGK